MVKASAFDNTVSYDPGAICAIKLLFKVKQSKRKKNKNKEENNNKNAKIE